MSSNNSIFKSASLISFATLCSRLLGFLRDIVIAAFFGTGRISEAFFVAFRIPNLLRHLVAEGAADSAFVPVFCEHWVKGEKKDFWNLVGNAFWIILITLLAISLSGILLSSPFVGLVAPGFLKEPEKFLLTVRLTRLLFPYLLLVGLAAYTMGLLHTFRSFAAPAFSPCLLNICMILSILVAYRFMSQPVFGLALGVLMGGALQFGIQFFWLFKHGFQLSFLRVKPHFSHPGMKKISYLLIPRIFATAVYQLNLVIDTILASFSSIVGQGAVSAIYYANRLIQFPLALFGIALSSAALPTLSFQAACEDLAGLRSTLSFSLRTVYFLMLPASLGLIILTQPIISILFQRGSFNHYSVQISSSALLFYAVGLFFFGGVKILTSGFYSLKDSRTPVIIAAKALLLNLILNIILMFPLKVGGLALASSLSSAFNFSLLYLSLKERIGPIFTKQLYIYFLKVAVAGIAMAGFILIFFHKIAFEFNPIIRLLVTIVLAGLVYFGICFLLRAEKADTILKWIKRS